MLLRRPGHDSPNGSILCEITASEERYAGRLRSLVDNFACPCATRGSGPSLPRGDARARVGLRPRAGRQTVQSALRFRVEAIAGLNESLLTDLRGDTEGAYWGHIPPFCALENVHFLPQHRGRRDRCAVVAAVNRAVTGPYSRIAGLQLLPRG